ncbi:SDR family NAD(P)-dependent oxidoreductase [Jannaschia helgolandensis]|uniref:3-oxoacyl-[acyl-carrier protein] reductase n=1 Tax=Jannaschia helgolandensis TaxID=188906 RepID=A0A1H7HGM1_9RHOB|nr:3-oxoacyl-ACP reductase family protein [Jannaschia helgolandensis]SEK48622.1 3-oxoacyl-[acyl-carrier protein] reductase [Jannaschia helgolandensis]
MTLSGKTAIVTGGGRDIGKACVMALAAEGANVVINYHSSSVGADSAVKEIEAAGGKALALKGDLTDQKDVDALIARTVETFGAVDVLVNNTGGLVARKTIAEMDLAHWNAVMDLNLTSAFLMIKACLPHMSAGSAIVNLASQAGRDGGGPGAVAYATSKGAMMTFTRGLAKELGPDIRVNAINPGMIDTDFHNIFTKDAVRANVANATPLKREGRPQEIGDLVVFLASDKSSFMTGTSIDINGGLLMS